MNMKQRAGRQRGALVACSAGVMAVMAIILIAGCGSSGGGSSTDTASAGETGAASPGQAGGPGGFELSAETQACLEEQGVELPEPGQGGPPEGGAPEGGPPAGFGEGGTEMKEALEECGAELPQGKPGGQSANPAELRESIKEYTTCMGENGYELPEPDLSGDGPVFDESEVDREDPKFEAANEKCQSLAGIPGGGGPPQG